MYSVGKIPGGYLKREGNKITVETSPASVIGVLTNRTITSGRTVRGEGLTHFEYEFKPGEKWVRVEVRDENGKRAWSNIVVI